MTNADVICFQVRDTCSIFLRFFFLPRHAVFLIILFLKDVTQLHNFPPPSSSSSLSLLINHIVSKIFRFFFLTLFSNLNNVYRNNSACIRRGQLSSISQLDQNSAGTAVAYQIAIRERFRSVASSRDCAHNCTRFYGKFST